MPRTSEVMKDYKRIIKVVADGATTTSQVMRNAGVSYARVQEAIRAGYIKVGTGGTITATGRQP